MPFSASFPLITTVGDGILTLEELFRQLSYGELSNLSVALDASGAIKKEKQNQIVHFANEALKKMHSRLPLKEESVQVVIAAGDNTVEFDDDALIVTSILNAYGRSFPFRTTPSTSQVDIRVLNGEIFIPENMFDLGTELQVTYRKRHAVLTPIVVPADLSQEIILIPELEAALRSYIAFKVYSGMGTQDSVAMAGNYQAMYEQTITEVLNSGILSGEIMPMSKLETRGFV